ncbi:MAG TPA: class 1 fructose-bisphosphatase [Rhodanobacteraceae bacterium]|jgi:fructose-1,6-bisphosphatase I/sedoheptulose-1,7-bisphosphatase|nr:class 1 fructose-bisphosphatase [Rhodanobacteraceae bacterium]
MLLTDKTTFTEFLIEARRSHPEARGDLNGVLHSVATACKAISRAVAHGSLADLLGNAEASNVHGERQKKLDVIANDIFIRLNENRGYVAGMASEELDEPYLLPTAYERGKYLLLVDPLDGSSNIDVNVSVGSIFSIIRAPNAGVDPAPDDFLQCGAEQVAAGYAIYGPSTMLVLTTGNGVHAFTLDPLLGEFILSHRNLRIPEDTHEFAINTSNSRFWEYPVQRYVDECLKGSSGARGKDFNMRWIASLVAETHRILMRGGVFMYPRDTRKPGVNGRLRLTYECNPIALLIEQAGGRASTGYKRMLDVKPDALHQKIGFVFGSRSEVERIERYHHEGDTRDSEQPLFAVRGLFRTPA